MFKRCQNNRQVQWTILYNDTIQHHICHTGIYISYVHILDNYINFINIYIYIYAISYIILCFQDFLTEVSGWVPKTHIHLFHLCHLSRGAATGRWWDGGYFFSMTFHVSDMRWPRLDVWINEILPSFSKCLNVWGEIGFKNDLSKSYSLKWRLSHISSSILQKFNLKFSPWVVEGWPSSWLNIHKRSSM